MTERALPAIAVTETERDRVPGASLYSPGGSLARLLVLFFVTGLVVVPLLATVIGGFKTRGELHTNPFGLPAEWIWQNYWNILTSSAFWLLLGNSLKVAVVTVVLTLVLAAPAAFAFAHLRFFGEQLLFNYILLGLTFPFATAILPLFLQIRDLGLLDSHWGIILPQVAFGLSTAVLLSRNAFRQVPFEVIESALVDGAGYYRIFWSIVLPLSLPILSTVAIITFVASWNNYLLPLVALNTETNYTWPLGLMQYQGQYGTDWPKVLAFITLTITPAIMAFLLAQKHIVAGLTAGAVKG